MRRGDWGAVYCEHANERPATCPCDARCYCKEHSCRGGNPGLASGVVSTPGDAIAVLSRDRDEWKKIALAAQEEARKLAVDFATLDRLLTAKERLFEQGLERIMNLEKFSRGESGRAEEAERRGRAFLDAYTFESDARSREVDVAAVVVADLVRERDDLLAKVKVFEARREADRLRETVDYLAWVHGR